MHKLLEWSFNVLITESIGRKWSMEPVASIDIFNGEVGFG
jgi:hypothetical protein